MIKKYFLFFFFLFSCALSAQPALSLDWEYKDPIDRGAFIKHDNHNNIITIGTGGSNIFGYYIKLIIIKHDTSGNLLWQRSFEDTVGGMLLPYDLKIDSADNIYLSGRAHQNPQVREGFLIKYDALGNFKWKQFYGTRENLTGDFNKMILFDNRYIYVAGKMDSLSGSGVRKSILVKYDCNGNLLWSKADSVNYSQEGKTVVVDKAGNVYMIGYTSCCLPGGKFFVEKFDSIGNQKWKTVLIDTAYQFGFPTCSIIDDSANIYVAGQIQGLNIPTGFDAGVIKMDSTGNLKWFSSFVSSPSNQVWESPQGILLDKSNNSYVFGNGFGGFIFKLNSNGFLQWSKLGNGSGSNNYFVMIRCYLVNDTTIISGSNGPTASSNKNYILISINTNGNANWTLAYPYFDSNHTSSFDLISDSTFFFTGSILDTNFVEEDSLFTIKLNRTFLNEISGLSNNSVTHLYPNPFNNQITIKIGEKESLPLKIDIYTILGEKVFTTKAYESVSTFRLDFLEKGIYILEITSRNLPTSKIKFIKT